MEFAEYQKKFRELVTSPDNLPLALVELETEIQKDLAEKDTLKVQFDEMSVKFTETVSANQKLYLAMSNSDKKQTKTETSDNGSDSEPDELNSILKEYGINE